MKSWLVVTSSPFLGTEQYYCAFCNQCPLDKIMDWFLQEETYYFWTQYVDEDSLEFPESGYDDYDSFILSKQSEWAKKCNIECKECSLKELQKYIPGGPKFKDDLPLIIYDERNSS